MSGAIKKRVVRAPARGTWEYEHRWGPMIGDSTTLQVTRVAGGAMTLSYGSQSVEIRKDLVEPLAKMIAEASAWTDEPVPDEPEGEQP